MSAYLIASLQIVDKEGFAEYAAKVLDTITAYGGKYLVKAAKCEVVEGPWQEGRCVVLEFPTMAQLRKWWDSPEYVPLREVRGRTARTSAVFTEGA